MTPGKAGRKAAAQAAAFRGNRSRATARAVHSRRCPRTVTRTFILDRPRMRASSWVGYSTIGRPRGRAGRASPRRPGTPSAPPGAAGRPSAGRRGSSWCTCAALMEDDAVEARQALREHEPPGRNVLDRPFGMVGRGGDDVDASRPASESCDPARGGRSVQSQSIEQTISVFAAWIPVWIAAATPRFCSCLMTVQSGKGPNVDSRICQVVSVLQSSTNRKLKR